MQLTSIGPECKLILYADDSAIYFFINTKILFQKSFVLFTTRLVDNKLSPLLTVQDFHIECNNHTINSTNQVKYLGILIDQFLSGLFIAESIVEM